jgi:hypothetical protein
MTRTPGAKEIETAVLIRMADSRATLLAANQASSLVSGTKNHSGLSVVRVIAALADAPHVVLLLTLCVGAIVLGPRRTIGMVGRSSARALQKGTAPKMLLEAK